MINLQTVDITNLAVLGEQFPPRLMQLGFRLMQVVDVVGRDQYRYVAPPTCEVPAGPFLMGNDHRTDRLAFDNERPQHTVMVGEFAICAYPLTVAEYACAVQVGAVPEPLPGINGDFWRTQQQSPDHPVVCITWQHARTYAEWFAQVTGQPWRLPTEAEWEKAARGIDGRRYPWGNKWDKMKAHTYTSGRWTTLPVGTYSQQGDASPYGVHDLVGTVWEWTSTTAQPYPYQANDGREDFNTSAHKVLRGGARTERPRCARAACRDDRPEYDSYVIGARLVCGRSVA
jgi:formylglycine-generating enzyme required for sulfatase activity